MIDTRGTQMLSTVDRWAGVIALHSMVCIFLLDLAPAFPLSNPAATDQSLEKKVSGRTYGAFLQENIFAPLGMDDTGHDGNAGTVIKNRASGYVPAGSTGIANAPCRDWTNLTGNGS